MTSARSVFVYLCVGLAAVAALALSAAAATSSGSHSCCTGIPCASNSEFLSGLPFNLAGLPAANTNARATSLPRELPTFRTANAGDRFQNTQESAGSGAAHVGSSGRNEKRGTGSL